MAINDSRQAPYGPAPPPTGRRITDDPLPDLSEAGFRLGGLAVSLVGSLFSGTQAIMEVRDPAVVSTSVVPENPVVVSTSVVVPTTVATSLAPATTVPISRQPEHESIEPNVEETIFGQRYLDSWPTRDMWDRVAWCESRHTWDVDTGNGYFGGLQFALGSWQWVGGTGSPADATKEEQIFRANLLWQAQGWNGWPGCKKYFGWTKWQVKQ